MAYGEDRIHCDPVMPQAQKKSRPAVPMPALAALSPPETARYTSDLLDSLRKIATRQGHGVLAHLLELAQFEAQTLAVRTRAAQAPRPRTPDSPDGGHTAPPAPAPTER